MADGGMAVVTGAPDHSEGGGPALRLDGAGLSVNGITILDGIGFSIERGEFVGLIGPNGAGKTSLINVITGITAATSGSVHVFGSDTSRWKPHRRARLGLGRTFQTSNLFNDLSVVENLQLAVQARQPQLRHGLKIARKSDSIDAAIAEVGLESRRDRLAGELSHGDRRKLELAVTIANKVDLLLLDEPMAGVSVEDVDVLVELIRRIHRTGVTVLMVEHHLDVVLDLSDRLAVLHHGALLAIDKPDVVIANPTVQTAYVGDAL